MIFEFMPVVIIPISKLLGNYNCVLNLLSMQAIIPISKLLGNYNEQALRLC